MKIRFFIHIFIKIIIIYYVFSLQGMTDQEIVAHHFDHSDSNQDGELDSREWLGYLRQEDPNLKRDRSTRMLR